MLQIQIITLIAVGVLATAGALLTVNDSIAIVAGVAGFGAFGLATFGLFNVEVVSNGTVVAAGSQPAIALFTAGLAALAAFPALTGPVELAGDVYEDDDPFGPGGV